MGTIHLNSSALAIFLGLTLTTVVFQNCTKAKFSIDETAKQQALNDGSVFGNTPGDDGWIAGARPPGNDPLLTHGTSPGDDGSNPQFPGMGNDPNVPKFPGMTNSPNTPATPSRTPATPQPPVPQPPLLVDGGLVTVKPSRVCPASMAANQSLVPATSKMSAVLYKFPNFIGGSPSVIQAWDTDADATNIRAQLMAMKPLALNLTTMLSPGKYSIVIYDAGKVKAPYIYDITAGINVIAPNTGRQIDTASTFTVTGDGKQYPTQSAGVPAVMGGPECPYPVDPLLVQLKTSAPQAIALTAPEDGVMFDLLGRRLNHKQVQTAWFATAKTENYFLVLPDKYGKVLGIDQLFGDTTFGPDGKYAEQGFAALAKYDESGDEIISEDDEVFSKLRLWKDDNLDGTAQESELFPLEKKGVVAIDLRFDSRYQETDEHGNMTKYKSVVVMKNGQYGLVYDLYLRYLDK